MRSLLRKRKHEPVVDRCPYTVRPIAGIELSDGSQGKCRRCDVEVRAEHDCIVAKITTSYPAMASDAQFRVVYPISEFGRVNSVKVLLDEKEVPGSVWKRGADNATWIPSSDPSFQLKPSTTDPKREADIYSFRSDVLNARPNKSFRIVLEISASAAKDGPKITFAVPYSCCPCAPSSMSFSCRMFETIRSMWSPNRANRLHPVIRGKRGEAHVEIDESRGARVEDYLFIVHVELGQPIRPECADPVALLIMVSAVASLVLFSLTHSVEADF